MTRWLLAIMALVAWVASPPRWRAMLWRVPVAVVLAIVALLCYLIDDTIGMLRRLAGRR